MTYEKKITKLEKQIAILKAKAAKAIVVGAKALRKHTTVFAKKHGFKRIEHLMDSLGSMEGAKTASAVVEYPPPPRKRSKVTDSLRRNIVAALKAGKTTAVVAKMHKVSTATVNNIKKAAGLTKSKRSPARASKKKKAAARRSKRAIKPKESKPKKAVEKFKPSKGSKTQGIAQTSAATPELQGTPV